MNHEERALLAETMRHQDEQTIDKMGWPLEHPTKQWIDDQYESTIANSLDS